MKTKTYLLAIILSVLFILTTSTATCTEFVITWNPNPETDLDGYNVYQSTTSGTGYEKINTAIVKETQYIHPAPENVEQTFYFVITAVDLSGNESGYSNEGDCRIDTLPPGPPTGCSATCR